MVKKAAEETTAKTCFVITPVAEDGSEIRRATEGLMNAAISPVLASLGYKVEAAHLLPDSGSITNQIIEHLLEDEMAIANLTGLNANVMYELAVRHAIRLPVVSVAQHGTKLPFDLAPERTLFYNNDMQGVEDLKPKLRRAIEAAQGAEKEPDNPIYRTTRKSRIISDIAEAGDPKAQVDKYIVDRLEEIQAALARLARASWEPFVPPRSLSSVYKFSLLVSVRDEFESANVEQFAKALSMLEWVNGVLTSRDSQNNKRAQILVETLPILNPDSKTAILMNEAKKYGVRVSDIKRG